MIQVVRRRLGINLSVRSSRAAGVRPTPASPPASSADSRVESVAHGEGPRRAGRKRRYAVQPDLRKSTTIAPSAAASLRRPGEAGRWGRGGRHKGFGVEDAPPCTHVLCRKHPHRWGGVVKISYRRGPRRRPMHRWPSIRMQTPGEDLRDSSPLSGGGSTRAIEENEDQPAAPSGTSSAGAAVLLDSVRASPTVAARRSRASSMGSAGRPRPTHFLATEDRTEGAVGGAGREAGGTSGPAERDHGRCGTMEKEER